MQQNTPEWHEMRKKYIGASDAPVIMKVSPWKTPLQLWEEKLGISKDQRDNLSMRFGRENEERARSAYEAHTGNLVVPQVVFHPTVPYMMASLDGLSMGGDIIVEIKNANKLDHEMARNGKIPEKYYPQLQHQLDSLPGSVLHYWSFNNNEGVLVEVERDEGYIKDLIAAEGEFWQKVLNYESPEATEKDYVEFVNDEDWANLVFEAKEIQSIESELKKRKEANRRAIKDKCRGRSAIGNGAVFTRSIVKGKIDYENIPELQNVDLSPFRKAPTERWSLTFRIEKK